MTLSRLIAAAAEDLIFQVRWMSGLRQERLGGLELSLFPGADPVFTKVGRVRLEPDKVEEALGKVRARVRSLGRTTSTWWLGPSTTPNDLELRLLDLGLVPFEPTTAMAATAAPVASSHAVRVQTVGSEVEADSAAAIIAAAFGMDADDEASIAAAIREEVDPPVPRSVKNFLALVDGLPVGTAASVYLDGCVGLLGGSTLPEARGRGVYRALVNARWEDAVAHGRPALVTQALDTTSKPILEHLGFVALFPIPVLRDTHP